MSILKSSIQPNGLKEISLGNSIGAFEKLLRDEYQRGNVVFQLDTHFLIIVFIFYRFYFYLIRIFIKPKGVFHKFDFLCITTYYQ